VTIMDQAVRSHSLVNLDFNSYGDHLGKRPPGAMRLRGWAARLLRKHPPRQPFIEIDDEARTCGSRAHSLNAEPPL
jgi:hypothetical protein